VSEPPTGWEIRRRTPFALAAFLAVSAAVHAAAIVAWPAFSLEQTPAPATVLEVVLVQTAPVSPQSVAEARATAATSPSPPEIPIPVPRKEAKTGMVPKSVIEPPAVAAAPTVMTLSEPAPEVKMPSPAERFGGMASPRPAAPVPVANAVPTPARFSASYLQNPVPRYPLAARRAGEQGTVTLKVLVSVDGLPRRVEVEKTSGASRLDAAALDAVRRWRFVPARHGAAPIESWVLVPVVFRLEEPS